MRASKLMVGLEWCVVILWIVWCVVSVFLVSVCGVLLLKKEEKNSIFEY